ncbi:EamA-like transporter family protein [Homoserinimonas aerilata]|uniref:EamA-like transporter family protein n=1 Tax=Homoserinimonas aerilata TaxID=1162970 RepID=A0A542XX74_9MICO|nr:EamA family transporter [Homoserinimonas aerilata]TQL40445.1 EamA-like transporter family protein [Homoserinimonas aerilata]
MLTVIVGLTGALIFGSADFLGGLASKRISSIRVTAIAAATGLVVLLLALPVIGGAWSYEAVLFGALSGIAGAGAIVLLYACLAIGPMSILSPLTALVSAVVPMTVGLARGEQFGLIGYIALGVALVAVVLVGFVPEKDAVRPSLRALTMAVGSGALIGVFMILIDLTPDDSGLVPLIANRAANGALMWAAIAVLAILATRKSRTSSSSPITEPSDVVATTHSNHPWLSGLRLALLCGALDAVANSVMLLGLRLGELSVMSVLTAMYPAGTIILAAIVLREKLTALQIVGLALAIAAAGMLALA